MSADEKTAECAMELTPREAKLMIKDGYPFPDDATPLLDSPKRNIVHVVCVDAFWVGIYESRISCARRRGSTSIRCSRSSEKCAACSRPPPNTLGRALQRVYAVPER